MKQAQPLRWGILGCARIARRGLIPGIRESSLGILAGIASRSAQTADDWAREFAIPVAYGSYQAMIDDPHLDAIYIPLPNELHWPWVRSAADRGKHILCEKPLALGATEAAAMVEYCQARGVILMEAFMWRHQDRTLALRSLVDSGAIGPLRLIRSSFSFTIDSSDWRLDPSRGGGALWDVGCYGVNTARLFAQAEPAHVHALAHMSTRSVDLSLTATLEFPNGVLAIIDCSFEQPYCCRYELVGENGVIEVPDAYLPPHASPTLARLTRSSASADRPTSEVLSFQPANQYAAMVDAFATSVAHGSLLDPAEDGLNQMKTLDKIRASLARPDPASRPPKTHAPCT